MELPPPEPPTPLTLTPEAAHALWQTVAGERGVSDAQARRLELYLELLAAANERMNLTRVADPALGRMLHIADSLTLLPHIPMDARLVADVGSGGGVPGLVLAVALPEARVVLIEATQKKAAFLFDVASAIGCKNVEVRPVRAEVAGRSDLRDACDVVVARAVGAMDFLAEWCLPLVRKGGVFLAMKGPRLSDELPAAARVLRAGNAGEPVIHPVISLPGQTGHVICEIRKLGKTDPKLPRNPTVTKGKAF